jgi:Zn finger protein HypA/HybF involved in hydrogenase expression
MTNIKIPKLTCNKCTHTWTPRKSPVYVCPKCHSPKWNEDEKNI